MENRSTQTVDRKSNLDQFPNDFGESDLKRLNAILSINAETASTKQMFASNKEKIESELIKNPLSSETAFRYFGLMLGAFPPAAIFARIFSNSNSIGSEDALILGILVVVNVVSAFTGYFSGKIIAKMTRAAESRSWFNMILLLPLVGMFWGLLSGAAGGTIFFGFGAIVGAFFGSLVGCVALPVFGIFHRILKKGDFIERNQFLPVAFGITFTICAFILGF